MAFDVRRGARKTVIECTIVARIKHAFSRYLKSKGSSGHADGENQGHQIKSGLSQKLLESEGGGGKVEEGGKMWESFPTQDHRASIGR